MLFEEFNIDIAKEVWQEEAQEKGRRNEKYDSAKTMLTDGEPVEKIMRYTKLTREGIEKLRDTE